MNKQLIWQISVSFEHDSKFTNTSFPVILKDKYLYRSLEIVNTTLHIKSMNVIFIYR